MNNLEYTNLPILGKVLSSVEQVGECKIVFTSVEGEVWKMVHEQDCCESVYIESVVGDLQDLVGSVITLAEEASCSKQDVDEYDSATWTFYKFATIKGYVDIRWLGESNGYYSEGVSFLSKDNWQFDEY